MHFLVPTRGRPANAERLIDAFAATKVLDVTKITFYIDEDDPSCDEYVRLFTDRKYDTVNWFGFVISKRRKLAGTLNTFAPHLATTSAHLGFMGDDHVPLTIGWDIHFKSTLLMMKMGFVYGNDLIQGENLPTAVAMTSNIVQTLGYMCAPGLQHMYVDNFWRDLGNAINGLSYLPNITIQHMHPIAGQVAWDEGYKEVNRGDRVENDRIAYQAYIETTLADDVWKLMQVKGTL